MAIGLGLARAMLEVYYACRMSEACSVCDVRAGLCRDLSVQDVTHRCPLLLADLDQRVPLRA